MSKPDTHIYANVALRMMKPCHCGGVNFYIWTRECNARWLIKSKSSTYQALVRTMLNKYQTNEHHSKVDSMAFFAI